MKRRSIVLIFVLSLLLVSVWTPSFTGKVHAATLDPNAYYKIVNRNSGKALDVSGWSTADGANIVQWLFSGATSQQWQFIDAGSGYYKIKNKNSGKMMDIYGASTADGAKNIQWPDNGGVNQQWQLVDAGGGFYKIKNKNSAKLLDITGASIADGVQDIQYTDNGGNNQQWQILPAGIDPNAYYKINNKNSGKALDVSGASTADGANIVQWTYGGGNSQQWQFADADSGYLKIKNRNSAKLMDIAYGYLTDGAINVQWTDNAAANQQWQLVDAGGGFYKIKNKNSSKILDITGSSTADGAQNVQWTDTGIDSQKWGIVKSVENAPINWGNIASATSLATTKHYTIDGSTPTRTYRSYIKPREYGNFTWRFWESNILDSTRADGSFASANIPGGSWRIEAAYIADGGTTPNGSIVTGTQVQLRFGGNTYKDVSPNEKFWSDTVTLNVPTSHYLAFTWTLTPKSTGKVIPYNCENLLASAYVANGNLANQESNTSFSVSNGMLVLPCLIGYQKTVTKRIAFFGDSITQGVSTTKDAYEYWAAKIANGLSTSYAVWDLGSGWARTFDAASDAAWLYKAKQNDEVNIILGVNDIGTAGRNATQIVADLTTVVSKLKQNNPLCNIILFTVPPFNFTGAQADTWRSVNNTIRTSPPAGVNRVFDIAAVLSQPAPNDNLVKSEYMSPNNDAHPNGVAGTAVANAYLSWY
jgi:hypothetical protein